MNISQSVDNVVGFLGKAMEGVLKTSALLLAFCSTSLGCEPPITTVLGSDGTEVAVFEANVAEIAAARANSTNYQLVPPLHVEEAGLLEGGCDTLPRVGSPLPTTLPIRWITQRYEPRGLRGVARLHIVGEEHCIQGYRTLGGNGSEEWRFFVGTEPSTHDKNGSTISIVQTAPPGAGFLIENPNLGAGEVLVGFARGSESIGPETIPEGETRSFRAPREEGWQLVIERPGEIQAHILIFAHSGP